MTGIRDYSSGLNLLTESDARTDLVWTTPAEPVCTHKQSTSTNASNSSSLKQQKEEKRKGQQNEAKKSSWRQPASTSMYDKTDVGLIVENGKIVVVDLGKRGYWVKLSKASVYSLSGVHIFKRTAVITHRRLDGLTGVDSVPDMSR